MRFSHTEQSVVNIIMDVGEIHRHAKLVKLLYPNNSQRKNYFLAACKYLDNLVDLDLVETHVPYGGIIGIDNSRLDNLLGNFKCFRLHAILHDAAGYMKTQFNVGPGYCYMLPGLPNICILGHVTGLTYCLGVKVFSSSFYDILEC